MTKTIFRYFLFLLLPGLLLSGGCGKQTKAGRVSRIEDLNSPEYRVGCMTGIAAAKEAKRKFPKAEFLEYPMPIDAFAALCAEKADAMVLDRPTLEFMALAHPELIVSKENIAVGHISVGAAKRSTELMEKVNAFIRKYRSDGTYRKMYDRWFRQVQSVMPEIPVPEKPSGLLKVGITANNEPMCFIQNGKMAGFDSEFSMRLALFLNRKIEFIDLPYDALPAALESGKINLAVAQMDALPEREESVLFSENYIDSPITVILHRNKCSEKLLRKILHWRELNTSDRTIASQTEIVAVRVAKKELPKAKFLEFTIPPDCYLALAAGKADAVVYDRPALEYAVLSRPEFLILPDDLAVGHISVAAAKGNDELVRKVNAFIQQYRADGTYRQMYNRWVRTKKAEMPEIPRVSKPSGKLIIGVDPTNPPMSFIRGGKTIGFDVEFALRLGVFLNKEILFRDYPYDGMIPAVTSGKIDLAIAQMDATPERAKSIAFSTEYIDSPIAMMIRRSDYAGQTDEDAAGYSFFPGRLKNICISFASSFEKTFIRESRWKLILQGLCTTVVITVFSVIFGTMFAFPVCKICRSGNKFLSWIGDRYVSLIMGTPILVILMILYYVVFAKVDISGIIVAILAFSMDFAAYTSITLRSGIESVPRGQTEAALALGHTPAQAFLRFVLPQAVRHMLPVYRGEIISTLKSTSIVGYIAIMDLTKMGDIIRSRTYEAFFPLIAIAAIYFLAAKCLTQILTAVEERLSPERRRDRLQKRSSEK